MGQLCVVIVSVVIMTAIIFSEVLIGVIDKSI